MTRTAFATRVHGITFAARADSNHWVVMDGPEDFGGSNAGTRPKELLLMALAGCSGSDIASILKKKRVPLDGFDMQVTAEQRDEHPQVYTRIHVEYVFRGEGIRAADVERAIELAETKYCAVSAMLRGSIELSHSYRIEAPAQVGA